MHDLRMIHTDLKPENILLVSADYVKVHDYKVLVLCLVFYWNFLLFSSLWSGFSNYFDLLWQNLSRSPRDSSNFKRVPKSSAIKVIDFGSTTYDRQDQNYIVSTRHYRAPEVILGKEF